mmetsp:Transcript_110050/g.350537  ORF Transcript_110050/g.350537 Transcript_110050/m.350537 type:complete len:204 (+) Transcript_110050:1693-2304(+)
MPGTTQNSKHLFGPGWLRMSAGVQTCCQAQLASMHCSSVSLSTHSSVQRHIARASSQKHLLVVVSHTWNSPEVSSRWHSRWFRLSQDLSGMQSDVVELHTQPCWFRKARHAPLPRNCEHCSVAAVCASAKTSSANVNVHCPHVSLPTILAASAVQSHCENHADNGRPSRLRSRSPLPSRPARAEAASAVSVGCAASSLVRAGP